MVQVNKVVKKLRCNQTKTEEILWEKLRANKLGVKIKRQVPITINYEGFDKLFIVDFCSKRKKLVIEVDGDYHKLVNEQDKIRDELLQKKGYKVIRFTNEQVYKNIDECINIILDILSNYTS